MRIVFTSLATHGHMYPLIPLAVAARDAGHQVVFATAEEFVPVARRAGLEGVAAGMSVRAAFAAALAGETRARGEIPQEELTEVIATVFGETMPRAFLESLRPLLERERPDLVVYESGNVGGALAARLAGIPVVGHGFGRVSRGHLGVWIRRAVRGFAAEIGIDMDVAPPYDAPIIDICPASAQDPDFLADVRRRIPLRPVGWTESRELPAGVVDPDSRRPLVYLTLGTAMGTAAVLRSAITGLAVLDVDVLVAAGPTVPVADLGAVPANVRVEEWVPQAALLPHVDLVVHHGGSGTMLGAFGAGAPQLLLPQGADQFTNADAVLALGVGDRLLGEEVTTEAVTRQARRLLDDEPVRDAARRLAAEVAAMPSPAEVADRLPALAEPA